MPASKLFAKRLKELREREDLTVPELADASGLAASVIYKAEDANRTTVRWSTVESAYRKLCRTPFEYSDLLMLWALAQAQHPPGLDAARQSLEAMIVQEKEAFTTEAAAMLREMNLMSLDQQRALVEFAKAFRRYPIARAIAAVLVNGPQE
jgi:transcriptional regulator with XRE-family HTH domain